MINILMSDDDERIHKSCIGEAKAHGIELTCCADWESAQLELENDFEKYAAVILDGRGKLNSDSRPDDKRHAAQSVGWLKEQNGKGKSIPVVIYTAYLENFELFEGDKLVLRMFTKHSDKGFAEVLLFLLQEIKNSPKNKLRTAHPLASSFAEKYFSQQNKQILLTLFSSIKSGEYDFIWKKNSLDALRRLNESLVDTIPQHFYEPQFELRDFIEKIKREGNPKATMGNRTVAIIDYFNNNKLQVPGPILSVIKNIYYTASTYASHNDESQSDFYPSNEIVLGLAYSHFGCYHWFNQIIKN